MPRLTATATTPMTNVQFIVSASVDLMNAMYFTSLAAHAEGVEGWPLQLRREMSPELLAELDFLYNFPAGDPGLMGTLGDNLFAHPEAWPDVEALLRHIRSLPDGAGDLDGSPGVQGLIHQATFRYLDPGERAPYEGLAPQQAVERRMRSLGDRDAESVMAWYDGPAELRERMARLVERFYQEHYRQEMPRRLPCLERSAASNRAETAGDVAELARRLTGRATVCLEEVCPGPYERHIFTPSLDMGPYVSCAIVGGVHGLIYPCERRFVTGEDDEEETVRLARIYRALSDEQRLRILRLLREREMYAQEIVERTGLHQPVVSRHLSFMKAVGLVEARRQNNMKFFSLNPGIREELARTLELFSR